MIQYFVLASILLTVTVFSAVPTNMSGFFRSGQVFLTWDEVTSGQKYIIYRSTSPITTGDLTTANKRFEVGPGSLNNKMLKYLSDSLSNLTGGSNFPLLIPPCTISKNIILPLDPSLSGNASAASEGTGMVVLTTHTAGVYYYAVTAVVGGVEDKTIGAGNTADPITEAVQDPAPVLMYQTDIKCGRLYLLYTDVDSFNPTYSGTYAWPFWVAVKQDYNTTSDKVDLLLTIEGMSGPIRYTQNYALWNSDGIEVKACETGSWWFGYSQTFPFDTSKLQPTASDPMADQGPVVNFVQARIMNFFKWMIQVEPYYANRIDTNRIHVAGGSMGGGGTLLFCQYYPDFFAYGNGDVPPTNYLETDWHWLRQAEARWGSHTNDNITIHFTGWRSERLEQAYGGMILHQFLNTEQMVLSMEGMDLPWISFGSGGLDGSVDWPQQGKNYFTNLDATRRGWNGGCDGDGGHGTGGNIRALAQAETIRKNNSFPAFSSVSGNPALPLPDSTAAVDYLFNKQFIWSTPHYKVGNYQNQVDETNQYEIVIASTTGDNTADITPRRLQNFVILPGQDYIVSNTAVNSPGTVFQTDTVTADSFGLVTFRGFQVKSGDQNTGGSRFIMVPLNPVSGTTAQLLKGDGVFITAAPNPFNPQTVITVKMKVKEKGEKENPGIKIFNIHGKIMKTVYDLHLSPNTFTFSWDASNLPSGVYIIKANIGNTVLSKKVMLMK
ncbi:MAG: hypothetical protein A2487_09320 [Candidatus Raymondbacteria bacterium RifOxyC12_full_50_8]|uniref:Secretion system C-terminal sorting domain-containing protein n=1 Tax=Candidatus Raymondbacteria bacterium RIFOXYD12_FULL_49_13 TaxID=1817890 RepID=A0A1F7FHZ9_UNCRA|nr:MAG: hypothetical protein A2248_21405 [Candidatus Raymondbacteria bacterium RIFOXYA2_FULL_49_16]OGJ96769.1 MAG: hypothetical protein A2487_09320 [Candidatus Raymondbacteria bacterium RifOxyC12_full_50_8]OGJ98664.1 MAG: hypothetical protein A2350_14055 [Candidatus Raymondbacteria bacterium RifOxyB12_full_50_8]OGK06345.1 MAG: hypothetical protein A2519_08725 [Candidatus Raymondbacteria bacterium RIFOXYD12_FULL_49_13]OGP40679.1 MAG: hypothetical protein A2324_03475 [Candidatus Raymondbacteria b